MTVSFVSAQDLGVQSTGTSASFSYGGLGSPTNFAIFCVYSNYPPVSASIEYGGISAPITLNIGVGAVLTVYYASITTVANMFTVNFGRSYNAACTVSFYYGSASVPMVNGGSIQTFTSAVSANSMSAPISVRASSDWMIVCTGITYVGTTGMSATPSLSQRISSSGDPTQCQIWDSNGQTVTPGTVANTIAWSFTTQNAAITFSINDVVHLTMSEAGNATASIVEGAIASLSEAGAASDTVSAISSNINLSITEQGAASDILSATAASYALIIEAGNAVDTLSAIFGTPIFEQGNAQDFLNVVFSERSTLDIIGVPGFAVAGPNAKYGSYIVNPYVGASPPILIRYDFSPFFEDVGSEYITAVVSPGGAELVDSVRTGRPLSQVNVLSGVVPTSGACTVMTNFDRSITMSFKSP